MQRHHRTRIAHLLGLATVALALLGGARLARADADQEAPVYAVQNRQFVLKHELNLNLGILPINAYSKGFTVGGGYTYHFSPMWAWEIAQFNWAVPVNTSLKQDLVSNFGVEPTNERFQVVQWFASSSVVLKPLYGKFSLGNRYLVHVEAFFVLGAGAGAFINPATTRPGLDGGVGLRFFISDHWSVRLDVRDVTYLYTKTSSVSSLASTSDMYLGLGIAVSFGGGAR